MSLCPDCEAELQTPLACLACGEILESGVETEVSPFEALGLEPGWSVDGKQLKQRLLKFSRAVHPDFFATADETTRARAERASASLNSAYEILSDDLRRADWLVGSLGGPSESEERQMPRAFLMQVLEWNEVLEDARGAERESQQWRAMEQLAEELRSERGQRFSSIAGLLSPLPEAGAASLSETRQELNAVRYIDRTKTEIKNLQLQASLGSRS